MLEEDGNELNPSEETPKITPRQRTAATQDLKDTIPELIPVPVTSFIPGSTGGIFGVGLLAPRIMHAIDLAIEDLSPKYIPIVVKPATYLYFFIEYANPNVATGLESKMVQFAVIVMLAPTSLQDVSLMLRLPTKKITPLSLKEYLRDSFSHPYYVNDSGTPLQIRYAEIPILKQKTPGRLDNIPLSYPDFDNTPDYITTSLGPIPAAPYTNFMTGTGCTLPISVGLGGTVYFVDASPMTPWQFAPTGWSWQFGPSASPTGSTAQNVLVTYGVTGTFTVTLTASNAVGSTTLTRTNFITVP